MLVNKYWDGENWGLKSREKYFIRQLIYKKCIAKFNRNLLFEHEKKELQFPLAYDFFSRREYN